MAKKATPRRSWGTCKQLPSKRYRATYVGPDGRTYAAPQTYAAKIDAEGWLSNEKRRIDLGNWRPPTVEAVRGSTFREYAATWLEQRDLKPRTRGLYSDLLRLHINPTLGDRALESIRPADVRKWHSGVTTGKTRKAHAYSLLHAIYATAVSDEVVDSTPCRIRGAMATKRAKQIVMLTPAELAKLADAMPEHLRLAVLLTAWCGLRSGELKELRRKDVGPEGHTLRVERAVTFRSGETLVDTPKTEAGSRTVTVPPHLKDAVKEHLSKVRGTEALLFPGPDGKTHMSDWLLRKAVTKAAKEIGKPGLTPHSLRHCGAVWAAQSGATTKELMHRIGHTTPNMAMRYQHAAEARDVEIAKRLSKMAGVKP
ncbi:tyrosine-type recombinase/integrase [Nocardia acidivorans]|uniref:tyrosine-type recombinase/integrase n=1 Tax=Nocardia acidivorans TaxID=404580 RepID=UPI000829EFFF|nr:site-specific integrase [Nocardia acidivorans]